jgi:hypothetical protein
VGAVDKVVGERDERVGGVAESASEVAITRSTKRSESVSYELGGIVFRLFDAEDGRPSGFVAGSILAGGLAELLGGLGHVEDVVDDLEGEAGLFTEGAEARDGVDLRSEFRA